MIFPELDAYLARVKTLNQSVSDRFQNAQETGQIAIFQSSAYYFGAYKKYLTNCHAFDLLVRSEHFGVAAAVLRMQLDVALRLFGLSLLRDHDEACGRLMSGSVRYNKLKHGAHQLSDAYLVKQLSERGVPWIKDVYAKTSGFVHLSEQHFQTVQLGTNGDPGQFTGQIGYTDGHLSAQSFRELCAAFCAATDLAGDFIARFFEGCVITPKHQAAGTN